MVAGQRSHDTAMFKQAESTKAGFKRPEYWVLAFGWSLGMCAGFVNAVSTLKFMVFSTHVTGSTTQIGSAIFSSILEPSDPERANVLGNHLCILFPFIFGAYLCGLLIDKNTVHFGGKNAYGLALVGNSLLLVIAMYLPIDHQTRVSIAIMAMACGLQNAMCSVHFGAVVRTTHVTGTATDIGSVLGRMVMLKFRACNRGTVMNIVERAEFTVDKKKLLVLAPMWTAYMVGGLLGTFAYTWMDGADGMAHGMGSGIAGLKALWFPAGFTMVSGVTYIVFRQNIVDAFEKAAKQEVPKGLKEVAASLGEESMQLKKLLQNPGTTDNKEKFMDLALEMERIENTIFEAKENIRIMQAEYDKIENIS